MIENRIKHLREAKGLGVEQLAEAIGRDRQFVWRVESGRQKLDLETVKKVAKALDCSVADVLGLSTTGPSGLSENAARYEPGPGHFLKPSAHVLMFKITNNDLADHPDAIRAGTVLLFDINQSDPAKIPNGAVVIASLVNSDEKGSFRGYMIGQWLAPNKIVSNNPEANWMVSLDDASLPFEPTIRGTMISSYRETN